MDDFPYLVAIALINESGKRAMPLGGKSINHSSCSKSFPSEEAKNISFELLTRIFERSENNPLTRSAKGNSFLLVEISIDQMQSKLPSLKSKWINDGNTLEFISQLQSISTNIWRLTFIKHQGISFDVLNI